MSFSCWCYLRTWDKDAEASFSRHITLPFAPTVGLCISFSSEDTSKIDRLEWDVERECFDAYFSFGGPESWCPCKPGDKCCILSVDYWVGLGWTLDSECRGYERMRHDDDMFEPEKWFVTAPDEPSPAVW